MRNKKRQVSHRLQHMRPAFERYNLVAQIPTAGFLRDPARVRILPVKFLDWILCRCLATPYRVAFKYGVTWQRGFFALVVNPVNAEAHATFRSFSIAPRSDRDVVIGK